MSSHESASATRPATAGGPRRYARLVAIVSVAAALLLLLRFLSLDRYILKSQDWFAAQGAGGAFVLIAVYVLATVLALPASLVTLVAGAVYGLWKGFVLVSFSSTLGATLAFLIARYVARDWFAKEISASAKFRALDEGVAREGWKLVMLTRLSPLFPFNLQNYGYGLTGVPLLHYVLASWVGMMPGTLTYVYLGYATAGLATAPSKELGAFTQWGPAALGLVATAAVTVVAARMAQRALARASAAEAAPPA